MTKSLVAFDTNKIKGYVFGTATLKEIRGASALLDKLNRQEMPRLVGEEKIYANGGAGLFVVETSQADAAIQSVQQTYHQKTYSASIAGASVELSNSDYDDIQAELSLIRHRLRAQKDSPTAHILPLTHSLLRFCDSCGVLYAKVVEDEQMLCQSCHTKCQEDKSVKEEIEQWTSSSQQPDSNRLWGRLVSDLGAHDYPTVGCQRPEDFDTLGNLSSPSGYMGLIYADGDGMGRTIEQIKNLAEMKQFAEAVDNSVYQATREAISRHLQPEQGDVWPFDVLLLGGDDLVMVTRAQSAIEVALHVVERFPTLTEEHWGSPLSLSASVVLAHTHYPIGSLLDLAESGLKFAKREAARRCLHGEALNGGMINFLVVSSANHLDFKQCYNQTLKHVEGETTLYRTQRPYTVQEMKDLLSKIKRVGGVPRGKLEQLRAAAFKSRQQGTLDAMMATLRLRNEDQRRALLELVGETVDLQIHLPWIKRDGDWVTPVLDIVELFDFVR